MGLLIILGSFTLMRALGVSNRLAWIFTLGLMVFPPLIRAERWLYYPYPLEFLTLAGAWLLFQFERGGRLRYFVLFCLTLTIVVLTRSLYHLIFWMLPLMALALWLTYIKTPKKFKTAIVVALIFFAAAGVFYVKNYVQYGMFASSTWQGLSMMEMTHYIPDATKQQMVQKGQITPLALIPNLSKPGIYYQYYHLTPPTENPVIDNFTKFNGLINYNNAIYARVGAKSEHNAVIIIAHHPLDYLEAVANEAYLFFSFKPYRYFDQWQTWLLPRTDSLPHFVFDAGLTFAVPLALIAMFILTLWAFLKPLWPRGRSVSQILSQQGAWPFLWIYAVFNIVYVTIISNCFDIKEGCFYRIPIDALLFIGTALAIELWLGKKQRGRLGSFLLK